MSPVTSTDVKFVSLIIFLGIAGARISGYLLAIRDEIRKLRRGDKS